ncbi:V/A-type H+-transporting ATPase subunit C [Caldanaerobius fijiensis DSM 17918]|uniref:V/A-type H+-transporting ATPase subunit C n=1 Tax=Caldanaerobius fijiensis DSM 17918 TaxID=1121256 RepID=A0A1M4W9Y8_9THEO|nr:V-type ATPase subunit [Caldanaerobius fijiensis]SHE77893.1 V/A-type H+-transporting ATPase subunit C [Caldanaerobius fijiensis DSM 17918]
MDKVTTHAAVNAKVRAMKGEFLTDDDYEKMLNMRSVFDVVRYLKENTSYKKLLSGMPSENVSRRDLESILKRNMIINIDRIIHYYRGDYRDFIKALYIKYEIEDLKRLARAIFNGSDLDEYKNLFVFIGKYSGIDPAKIFASRSIGQLIQNMEGSDFYPYLKPLLEGRRDNLFYYEMAIDMAYFSIIQKHWQKLSKDDREALEELEGTIADLYNLQWIYRGMKFYRLSPEELLNYTMDLGRRLTYRDRRALCYARSLDELYSMTMETPYAFLFNKDTTRDIYMERRINRYIFYTLKKIEKSVQLNIIHVVAYVLLLEFEIRDIISIVESIRYGMPVEEARKFLIREL